MYAWILMWLGIQYLQTQLDLGEMWLKQIGEAIQYMYYVIIMLSLVLMYLSRHRYYMPWTRNIMQSVAMQFQ